MNLRQSLGTTVKRRREALGLSQVQLAERMGGGVQQPVISRIERGFLPWPRPDLLSDLGYALGMSGLELITLSGWMSQEELEMLRARRAATPAKVVARNASPA